MVLLHEHKHEDGIKNFFLDVWEAYLKVTIHPLTLSQCHGNPSDMTLSSYLRLDSLVQVSMNPFQDANAPIENAAFDARVRAAAKKFL